MLDGFFSTQVETRDKWNNFLWMMIGHTTDQSSYYQRVKLNKIK